MKRFEIYALGILLITGCLCSAVTSVLAGQPLSRSGFQEQPIETVKAYLQARRARDFRTAYHFISAADRRIRDAHTYLASEESLDGFALDLARKLATDLEARILEQDVDSRKARLDIAYRVPTGDELSAQLFDWSSTKLNALPSSAQQRLASALDELKQRGKMITLEGRETFELVREKNGWKIFLDWASRTRVIFKSVVPRGGELEVRFARNDLLVEMNNPFQIDFTLKNRSAHPIVARLNHLIEPRRFADHVEMIACGSLAPVRLEPGETREVWSSYILGGVAAKSRLAVVYKFSVARPKTEKTISPNRHAASP